MNISVASAILYGGCVNELCTWKFMRFLPSRQGFSLFFLRLQLFCKRQQLFFVDFIRCGTFEQTTWNPSLTPSFVVGSLYVRLNVHLTHSVIIAKPIQKLQLLMVIVIFTLILIRARLFIRTSLYGAIKYLRRSRKVELFYWNADGVLTWTRKCIASKSHWLNSTNAYWTVLLIELIAYSGVIANEYGVNKSSSICEILMATRPHLKSKWTFLDDLSGI